MAIISAQQLKYPYSWTAIPPDDARITGKPDATFLNRHEGYEVLYFLNHVCQTLASALKAERMIHTALPATVRSRKNVLEWLKQNWDAH